MIAGVIGRRKFICDLWGDTVDTARRMESHGLAEVASRNGPYRRKWREAGVTTPQLRENFREVRNAGLLKFFVGKVVGTRRGNRA